jgi:hypothetical protein
MCNHILQVHARRKAGPTYNARFLHNIYVLSFLILTAEAGKARSSFVTLDFSQRSPNDFHYFTDLMKGWRKCLTPEAETPNMAVAPAAAFPSIVVPLIRMPE